MYRAQRFLNCPQDHTQAVEIFPDDQSKENSQVQVLSPRVLKLKADQGMTSHTILYNAIVKNCTIICKIPSQ